MVRTNSMRTRVGSQYVAELLTPRPSGTVGGAPAWTAAAGVRPGKRQTVARRRVRVLLSLEGKSMKRSAKMRSARGMTRREFVGRTLATAGVIAGVPAILRGQNLND